MTAGLVARSGRGGRHDAFRYQVPMTLSHPVLLVMKVTGELGQLYVY